MKVDEEYLKKIEENIINRVHKEVEERLFRKYFAMGAFVAAVTGIFGWSVIGSINEKAEQFAGDATKPAIDDAKKVIADAKTSAADANAVADTAERRLEDFDDFIKERQAFLRTLQIETGKQSGVVGDLQIKTQNYIASAKEETEKLDEQREELSGDFTAIKKEFNLIQAQTDKNTLDANKFANAANLERLEDSVVALGAQLVAMNNQLDELARTTPSSSELSLQGADSFEIEKAISDVSTEKSFTENETTVYFQFAGSTRKLAEAISSRLVGKKYIIPSEERISSAAGLKEIRFYYETDRDRSKQLETDVNAILLSMGLQNDVTVNDLINFDRTKPRRGTVELWLEPIAE
jgi:hypothetical protein